MAEIRMDLKEAGKLLGLTPNAVRSRAEKGQSPFNTQTKAYEKDNKHKWFVFLDPDKIANDPASNPASNGTSIRASKRTSNEGRFEGEIKALQGHVKTLSEALSIERAETARLRLVEAESVNLKVDLARLTVERDELKKAVPPPRRWWQIFR